MGRRLDDVERYAREVARGRRPAGRLHRLACERHLRDLVELPRRGFHWDRSEAERVFEFYGRLKHSKGEWYGREFVLEPWQQFIVGSLMAWRDEEGLRRFRRGYVEVPRKNGKTMLLAGLCLCLAFFDGEPGAEVYCIATKLNQARLVFDPVARMVMGDEHLRSVNGYGTLVKYGGDGPRAIPRIADPETNSIFEPLPADSDKADGLNPHAFVADELHEHPDGRLVDKVRTGMGSRRQPLEVAITTAGHDRTSFCFEVRKYSSEVLERLVDDERAFAFIAGADEGDDWRSPATWKKANPNFGVSVKRSFLEQEFARARRNPAEQNTVRRMYLNEWTEQDVRWLDLEQWDACGDTSIDESALEGRACYGGLDLGATSDLAALALVFPDGDEFDVVMRCWVPSAAVKGESGAVIRYRPWIESGLITVTDGSITDFTVVRRDVNELAKRFRIRLLAFDAWAAAQLSTELEGDGIPTAKVRQGYADMAEPTKRFEELVVAGKLRHGGNPVLRWMAGNAQVAIDSNGNRRPVRPRERARKVDGIVAAVMGLRGAILAPPVQESVYESRGIREVPL